VKHSRKRNEVDVKTTMELQTCIDEIIGGCVPDSGVAGRN
jgi:hypothetical protein